MFGWSKLVDFSHPKCSKQLSANSQKNPAFTKKCTCQSFFEENQKMHLPKSSKTSNSTHPRCAVKEVPPGPMQFGPSGQFSRCAAKSQRNLRSRNIKSQGVGRLMTIGFTMIFMFDFEIQNSGSYTVISGVGQKHASRNWPHINRRVPVNGNVSQTLLSLKRLFPQNSSPPKCFSRKPGNSKRRNDSQHGIKPGARRGSGINYHVRQS